jgi:hypothetical protein
VRGMARDAPKNDASRRWSAARIFILSPFTTESCYGQFTRA